ncbi:mechanosensitive ion channel family protein [Candidatus Nitrosocosmicus hydrocola]|uniref:mechanosensitive ion channel family protein n=1 Tax=Candidatus Nitrosocosmicus hydrocola TaxID=1826872 RepID=UPI0011E5FB08|nr:mechanosensitive ion channel family protein [Candidatus Nitrosocosmicus hydrocola]
MNFGSLEELSLLYLINFPFNIPLSIVPETSIIESDSATDVDESSTRSSAEDPSESQLLNDDSISSSSSTTESISIPEEKTVESNTTALINADSNSNLFAFDIGNYVDDVIITLIVILSSVSIYLIIHYTLKRSADSLNIKERRIKGIDSLVKTMLIVISSIIILFQFSTVSATVAGFISIGVGSIIGFSSRNTISNAIAGIILLSSRPFKLGDRVQIGNDESLGDVIEISLIFTKIKTIRNEMVTIPNQVLLQNQIKNYSGYKFLALSIIVSAGYREDEVTIKSLLLAAANDTYGLLKEPKPYVLLKELGDFAAIYELMVYTDKANMSIQIKSDLRINIYNFFKEAKIDLTTPRIVDAYKTEDSANTGGISLQDEN